MIMDTQTIHANLYITHEDETVLASLADSLAGEPMDRAKTLAFARRFDPDSEPLVDELFKPRYVTEFDFDEADEEHGYIVLHLELGEWGDSAMVHWIDFMYALIPGIQAQAWGYTEEGEEGAWEFFIKFEDGRAIKQEHTPWEDAQMDADALEYIYTWWHEDMPDEIEAGLLSDEAEDQDEDDYDDDEFDDEIDDE
jgi:hypothetical protein